MYCHDTTKTSTPRASFGSPSQSCLSQSSPKPAPSPKFGSSSALYVIEMAAEDSSSGMKYSTARNPRYLFLESARNTPSRIDRGVCTSHERIMISNVTHSECGSAGSESSPFQLVRPVTGMSPMPAQVVKLRNSTPSNGMIPNATNIRPAGSAIHPTEPLRPRFADFEDSCPRRTAGGASVVIYQ